MIDLTRQNPALFSAGQCVASQSIAYMLKEGDITQPEIFAMLDRHTSGDWGDVCAEDAQANDEALRDGDRLLSEYMSEKGSRVWVITEWDRSLTTVLLPEEY